MRKYFWIRRDLIETVEQLHLENKLLRETMSELSDSVTKLTTAVTENTAACETAAQDSADTEAAITQIDAQTAAIEANTKSLTPAAPVTPAVVG